MNNLKHIYMVGIGGISMSAIAEYFLEKNYKVSGSDKTNSKIIDDLRKKGAKIYIGHNKNNLDASIDLVVYTVAIHDDNPELIAAKEMGIKLMNRAKVLGLIAKKYEHCIAIAGCHGKTSTSSIICEILIAAGKDPTIFLGGILSSIKKNFRIGNSQYIVIEACEYCDSFLNFFPEIAVITNIDLDHLDYFKDINNITESFKKFAGNSTKTLIINQENKNKFINLNKNIISFSLNKDSDWYAFDITYKKNQCAIFSVINNKDKNFVINNIELKIPGDYNILNSLAAIAVAYELKIDRQIIKSSLESFYGTERRFEIKGKFNDALIVDDYAHHPNEIRAVLSMAKKIPHKNLWCVFQPHTYTRTKILFDDFAHALCLAEKVIVLEIYAAREKNIYNITSQGLVERINSFGGNAIYIDSFEDAKKYIQKNILPNDLLITMGAGEANKIAEKLLKE